MTKHKSFAAWQEAHAAVNQRIGFCQRPLETVSGTRLPAANASALSAQVNISEGYGFGSHGLIKKYQVE
jgi:hypothetical protein